ncbi:MAG: N-acetyltransferase family protein [Acidimicrobiales bacterium]|jgi:phosphinothricin acetyltransferase
MRTRLVEIDDATALMNILNPEVVELSISFELVPKSLEEQREWIREHQATHLCLVAVNTDDDLGEIGARDERILGFASVSPFRERPAYATTVENSVYVHRGARGRGVGERLLNDLLATAKNSGFHSVIARIVGENASSIRLHEKCGFTLVGTEVEVGRKHGRWLDVVEYQYVMPDKFR